MQFGGWRAAADSSQLNWCHQAIPHGWQSVWVGSFEFGNLLSNCFRTADGLVGYFCHCFVTLGQRTVVEQTLLRNLRYLCQQREDVRRKAVESFRTMDAAGVDFLSGGATRLVGVGWRRLGQSSKEKQTTQVVASMDSICDLHWAVTQFISKVSVSNRVDKCLCGFHTMIILPMTLRALFHIYVWHVRSGDILRKIMPKMVTPFIRVALAVPRLCIGHHQAAPALKDLMICIIRTFSTETMSIKIKQVLTLAITHQFSPCNIQVLLHRGS